LILSDLADLILSIVISLFADLIRRPEKWLILVNIVKSIFSESFLPKQQLIWHCEKY